MFVITLAHYWAKIPILLNGWNEKPNQYQREKMIAMKLQQKIRATVKHQPSNNRSLFLVLCLWSHINLICIYTNVAHTRVNTSKLVSVPFMRQFSFKSQNQFNSLHIFSDWAFANGYLLQLIPFIHTWRIFYTYLHICAYITVW